MRLTGRAQRRVVWSAMGVALLAAAAAVLLATRDRPAAAAGTTATVQQGTVTVAVSAAGTVESAQTRGLSFAAAGTVMQLTVKAGDLVTAGTVLARIDPDAAEDSLADAQQRLADARDAVDRATETANLPSCPTSTPTPTPAPQASGQPQVPTRGQTQAQAQSPQECKPAGRTSVNDALLSAQQQYNNAQLQVSRARTRLNGTTITAPIAGRVLSVAGTMGSTVGPGVAFLTLGDMANLTVRARFSEADVGQLTVGQTAAITLPEHAEPVAGKVSQIDPAGTSENRLVRYGVTVAFDTLPAGLLLGQSATVVVTTESAPGVLYVSSAALRGLDGSTATVLLRTPAGDVERRVSVGLRGDQYTEIREGLSEGDTVLLGTGDS